MLRHRHPVDPDAAIVILRLSTFPPLSQSSAWPALRSEAAVADHLQAPGDEESILVPQLAA
jgi:hypothetical protein